MKTKHLIYLSFAFVCFVGFAQDTLTPKQKSIDSIISAVQNSSISDSEKDIPLLNNALALALEENDSIRILNCYRILGYTHNFSLEYQKAFTNYFKALEYIPSSGSYEEAAGVYNNLGVMFSHFKVNDVALEMYDNALKVTNKDKDPLTYEYYIFTLLNKVIIKKQNKNFNEAIDIITSCEKSINKIKILDSKKREEISAIINIEKIDVLLKWGRKEEALALALEEYPNINNLENPFSHSAFFLYFAETYRALNKNELALHFALKADSIATTIDFSDPLIHRNIIELLADVHEINNNPEEALMAFKRKSDIDRTYFNAQNSWSLYKLNKDLENLQKDTKSQLTQKDTRIENILLILYISIGLFLLGIGLYIYKIQHDKHQKEKNISKIELIKTKEDLAIKQRELTTVALQTIASGERIEEFKNEISEIKESLNNKQKQVIDKLVSLFNTNKTQNWEEFRSRFEQINPDFFQNLRDTYPKLTPTDMKLCSYLKLNFNSKDIANLMGISPESVKINRYRLRKKMELERSTNLVHHINSF